MKCETDTYEQTAGQFMRKWGISFLVRHVDNSCPPFCDDRKHIHGQKYLVTLIRDGKRIEFPFWNSFNDAQAGKSPSVYDVMARCSSDFSCPDTFEEFCAEYGYDTDSRRAEKLFAGCLSHAKALRQIFDGEEIEAELSTIV